jgi:hypothetical protein
VEAGPAQAESKTVPLAQDDYVSKFEEELRKRK